MRAPATTAPGTTAPGITAPATAPGRGAGRGGRLLLIAALAALFGCWSLLAAPAAAAHNTLDGSDPAADSVVATMPASVSLTFDQAVGPTFATLALTPSGGEPITLRATVSGDSVTAQVPPSAAPAAGTAQAFQLAYRVVSADGHPVTGALEFTVGGTEPIPFGQPPVTLAPRPTPAGTSSAAGTDGATSTTGTGRPATAASATTAPAAAATSSAPAPSAPASSAPTTPAAAGSAPGTSTAAASAPAASAPASSLAADSVAVASSAAPASSSAPAGAAEPAAAASDGSADSTFPWWWIVVGVVVIGGLAFVVLRRLSATDDD